MEEIRLWKLSSDENKKPTAITIEPITETTTEKLLEETLISSPELLLTNLRLIGRQNETSGGPLDLLGIDEDGRLVVFELKRGNLTRDAVAQAIDYASFLADLEPDDLARHIESNSGKLGTDLITDFSQWYQNQFQRAISEIGTPRVILVGLGVDERAKRMVAFLARCELDISLITFQGFKSGADTLLARQVEVQARTSLSTVKTTKHTNQTKLDNLLEILGIKKEYELIAAQIKSGMGSSCYQWPNANGYSFYLQEISESGGPTNRSYLGLYAPERLKGQIQIYLQQRAVEAVGKEFLDQFAIKLGSKFSLKQNGTGEVWVSGANISEETRNEIKIMAEMIFKKWQLKMESATKSEQV